MRAVKRSETCALEEVWQTALLGVRRGPKNPWAFCLRFDDLGRQVEHEEHDYNAREDLRPRRDITNGRESQGFRQKMMSKSDTVGMIMSIASWSRDWSPANAH